MTYDVATPDAYIAALPSERQAPMEALRKVIRENLPAGFEETINYGMIGYVVPHSLFPSGYHCSPEQPLPFVNIASQKNFIAIYHMGLYADASLLRWFTEEYPKYVQTKLDMGKSCIRFKKPEQIPFALIGELMQKMTPQDWIACYEEQLKRG
ncbi:MAG: DUF1801 domain-containing protein [Bacteroidetes bacterium]|nr:DUF1801 domain-containing protein [Bacteroidota bacterium]